MKYTLDEYPTLDLTKKTIWTPTKIELNYFNKINFEKERQLEKERQIEKVRQTKLNVNAQPFTHISYSVFGPEFYYFQFFFATNTYINKTNRFFFSSTVWTSYTGYRYGNICFGSFK